MTLSIHYYYASSNKNSIQLIPVVKGRGRGRWWRGQTCDPLVPGCYMHQHPICAPGCPLSSQMFVIVLDCLPISFCLADHYFSHIAELSFQQYPHLTSQTSKLFFQPTFYGAHFIFMYFLLMKCSSVRSLKLSKLQPERNVIIAAHFSRKRVMSYIRKLCKGGVTYFFRDIIFLLKSHIDQR